MADEAYTTASIQKMREDRMVAVKTIHQLRDRITAENRDFNSEERSAWDKANKDYDRLHNAIDVAERAREIDADRDDDDDGNGSPWYHQGFAKTERNGYPPERKRGDGVSTVDLAIHAWAVSGRRGKEISGRQRRACERAGINPNASEIDIPLFSNRELKENRELAAVSGVQYRAQGVATGAAGGFTVPTTLRAELEKAMKIFGPVRRVAHVIRTPDGGTYNWPTVNDTTNVGAILAENTTVGAAVDVTFANTQFTSYKYSSGLVLCSAELDQDSDLDLGAEIGMLLGERLARGQDGHFTTGTGSSQPAGIVTGATLGKTTASSTAIAADEVFDLYHSVDPAYRDDPSCAFMAHDNIVVALRKLKDTTNNYLWQSGMQDATPDRLLGKPLVTNNSMASAITTGQKTMLFGAMSKYKIRDVVGVRLVKLVERYADADQIGYLAFLRTDAKVLNAGTNPLKYMAQL